jgi:hypothetical protein
MLGPRPLVTGALAGVLAGTLVAGAVVASGWVSRPRPTHGAEATAEFLQAWSASRYGTYVVEAEFVRRTGDGRELESAVRVAQDPPNRVVVQFDAVDARVDGRPLRCTTDPAGEVLCGPEGEAGADYDEIVDAEIKTLLGYLIGDPPLYAVEGDGDGCFDLTQQRDFPLAPYGDRARFCFDDETGAMTLARIERREATDETRATSVSGEVSPGDLVPPTE